MAASDLAWENPSERQICQLVLEGNSILGIAEQLGLSPGGVRSKLNRVHTRTGIHGRSAMILALTEAGVLTVPISRAQQLKTSPAVIQSDPFWLLLAEISMLDVSLGWLNSASGRSVKQIDKLCGRVTRLMHKAHPGRSVLNQMAIDRAILGSIQLPQASQLQLVWGPLLWYLLMGYAPQEIALALCKKGWVIPAKRLVDQWLVRLWKQCGSAGVAPTLVRLVRQRQVQLPYVLQRATDRLKFMVPDAALSEQLDQCYDTLVRRSLPLGVNLKDQFGLCDRLGVANPWQAMLVAAYLGRLR